MAAQRLLPLASTGPCCSTEACASSRTRIAPVSSVRNSCSSISFSSRVSSSESLDLFSPSRHDRSFGGGRGVARAALFPFLGRRGKDKEKVKMELLNVIAPLDRGAKASPDDLARVEQVAQELEKLNPTREPLKSPLLNGKWKLIYTTSESILKLSRPQILRPNGPIYQSINTDTLRAQNAETWPFYNQVTANLDPITGSRVAVKFDFFKIGGLVSVKAPGRATAELEITYVDYTMRISRGDEGNLFVFVMEDPDYAVPL